MTHEATPLLSEYIRINTTNPPGNESRAADFWEEIFTREKISFRTYESFTGRVSLKAIIPGKGTMDPLILLNHMDVVPADASQWQFDPFGGEVRDGFVHGRGTLDMKGLAIMQLMAFLHVHRQKIQPERDLIFLSVADEETGGSQGAKYLLEHFPEDFSPGLVLNEGGVGVSGMISGADLHMVSVAEKGPCWLRLSCSGPPGHGSMPHQKNALEILVRAVHRILAAPQPWIVSRVVAEYFCRLARKMDFLQPFVQNQEPETLKKILCQSGLADMPLISAQVQNTISLNMLRAGDRPNVIPDAAEAFVDIRLLPGQDPETFIRFIKKQVANDAVHVEPVTVFPATQSSMAHPDCQLLMDLLQQNFPDAVVTPSLTVGTTDSRFFREKGFRAYGFGPITIPLEDIKSIHGINEKISEKNLIRGSRIYTDAVLSLCQTGKETR